MPIIKYIKTGVGYFFSPDDLLDAALIIETGSVPNPVIELVPERSLVSVYTPREFNPSQKNAIFALMQQTINSSHDTLAIQAFLGYLGIYDPAFSLLDLDFFTSDPLESSTDLLSEDFTASILSEERPSSVAPQRKRTRNAQEDTYPQDESPPRKKRRRRELSPENPVTPDLIESEEEKLQRIAKACFNLKPKKAWALIDSEGCSKDQRTLILDMNRKIKNKRATKICRDKYKLRLMKFDELEIQLSETAAKNTELENEIAKLREENEKLRQQNKQLWRENRTLKESAPGKINELTTVHTTWPASSGNSLFEQRVTLTSETTFLLPIEGNTKS